MKGELHHVFLILALGSLLWLIANSVFWTIAWGYVAIRVMKFLFIVSKSFVVHYVTSEVDLSNLKDDWTLVTGGTDGIGRAYVNELARARGLRKFYLIGRNEKKLNTVAGELRKKYGAEVKTAIFDFASDDWSSMPAEISTMNIGILINFAGLASPKVGNLVEQDEGMASRIMQVNALSSIKMNELVLPGMLKRDRGIVVNMASMTGWRPLPYMSAYPASKAAISFFTDALSDELRHTNVKIQCLVPMLVATGLASYDASDANDIFVVSTENFARQAVRAIGAFELITGCWQHDLQIAFGTLVSFWAFKQLFVPLVMLGVHKRRLEEFHKQR